MATIPTNAPFLSYSTLDTFPLSGALTGTVTASSTAIAVVGVGTKFTTEIGYNGSDITIPVKYPLGYLWNGTTEYRAVVQVDSDLLLYIESPFTVGLTGATVKHIPATKALSIAWVDASGSGGGTINGIALAANESGEAQVHNFVQRRIQPIIVDGSSGTIHVLASYS